MRSVVLVLLVAALLAPVAPAAVTVRTPVDDVGIPFWCDWGYDWDERCYGDRGPRLPVGGAGAPRLVISFVNPTGPAP